MLFLHVRFWRSASKPETGCLVGKTLSPPAVQALSLSAHALHRPPRPCGRQAEACAPSLSLPLTATGREHSPCRKPSPRHGAGSILSTPQNIQARTFVAPAEGEETDSGAPSSGSHSWAVADLGFKPACLTAKPASVTLVLSHQYPPCHSIGAHGVHKCTK